MRQHHGEVIGPGRWDTILDRDQWERVRAILLDPSRRTNPGAHRVHLLSAGISLCGVCGAPLRVGKGKAYKGISKDIYRCGVSSCVTRDRAAFDSITRVVCDRLALPDAVGLLRRDDTDLHAEAREEVESLRSRLTVAAADYADGRIDADHSERSLLGYGPGSRQPSGGSRIWCRPYPPSSSSASASDIRLTWGQLDASVRRQVISTLMIITVLRTLRRGHGGFDPSRVLVEWKS